MATGGQPNPSKDMCPNSDANSSNSHGENRPVPWTLLPNNLELLPRSKPTKKQRNKDKSKGVSSSTLLDTLLQSVSDADNSVSKRNIKPPVNQRAHSSGFHNHPSTSKSTMENENNVSKEQPVNKHAGVMQTHYGQLKDCQSQVDSVLQQFEGSEDPRIMEQIQTMKNLQEDLAQKEVLLRNFAKQAYENSHQDYTATRETNGVASGFNDEEASNIQNHLLEKVKISHEKLMTLREHQSYLLSLQKKAEDSLAAFEAHVASADQGDVDFLSPKFVSYMNSGAKVNSENISDNSPAWMIPCSSKSEPANQQCSLENGDVPQDLSRLHVNLDHIKRRLELLQQLSSQDSLNIEQRMSKNVGSNSPMPDDYDDDAFRRTAIEYERTKLKNTLAELQEKQKLNETLKKQLLVLKDAANAIQYKEEDFSNVQDNEQLYSEENIRTIEDLRDSVSQLRRMLANRSISTASNDDKFPQVPTNIVAPTQQDVPSKLPPNCPKRDNIRKEKHNQFPARRHYEAEGRANEDPVVPAAIASLPPDPNSWENGLKIQEKAKQLETTKLKLKVMQNLVSSIQDARNSGQQVPVELLQVLASFDDEDVEDEEDEIDFDDTNTVTDNEDSQDNTEMVSSVIKNKPSDSTRVKECDMQGHRYENERGDASSDNAESQNLEHLVLERERLIRLQEKFLELHHKVSSKQNNDNTRCSGEGGNLQDRKSRQVSSPIMPLSRHRQDNLLTRQNVESQNRNNIPKTSLMSLKKDNINDLSAKLIKPGSSSRVSSDTLNKFNAGDSFNPDQSRDDIQQKSVLVDLLKQGKNKAQNYMRRDNQTRSNSSINSEPLDGSSRSFPPDTTVAATWGGSSTQENFEDENDPESLEDQEEEEEDGNNNEAIENISTLSRRTDSTFNRYQNEAYPNYAVNSSVKRRDNRLHKYFKSTQLNQWSSKKNFSEQHRNQNLPSTSEFPSQQVPDNSHVIPMPVPSKFVQQLQEQLDKLNALCRPVLSETHTPELSSGSFQPLSEANNPNAFPYPASNSGRPVQPINDVMQLYAQQLQLQQQLLLSLSPCYHALYLQQLEIQHLNRCLQQNPESDNNAQPLPSAPPLPDDFTFRPWFLQPWFNSGIPPFNTGQVSPISVSPFLPSTQPPFFNTNVGSANASTTAPCALVTGVTPARAVVHPDRQNAETLNNQVPPRTRANNFWDNFRSQSRQNLLSNNARSKDGHFNSPQVRQVHPVVPNESSWTHRSRVFIPPHTEGNSAISSERTFSRSPADSSFRIACRAKKPNWSRQPVTSTTDDATVSSTSNRYNLCPETDQVYPSTSGNTNNEQPSENIPVISHPTPRLSQLRPRSKATTIAADNDSLAESLETEMNRITSMNDNNLQASCLVQLLREVRHLKADSLQRALNAVRELVNRESDATNESSSENFEGNNSVNEVAVRENAEACGDANQENSFSDPQPIKNSENSRTNHNWPPATIIPLGKHTPKPCTGAVKKHVLSEATVTPSARAWVQAAPFAENEAAAQFPRSDSLDTVVSRIIQSLVPFVQSYSMDDCSPSFRASFCARVIDVIKTSCPYKVSPEFLLQLHTVILQLLNRFSNIKIMDCQNDIMKHLGSILYRELEIYKSCRPSIEDGCDAATNVVPKKSAQPDLLPSSSKLFCEMNKQVLPTKDDHGEDGDFEEVFNSQEYENQIGQLFICMPSEENVLVNSNPIHDNEVASSGSPRATQTINAEEDMGYLCEAEGQPEVEASTEADLAEADQSPGTSGGAASNDTWHMPSSSRDDILNENSCFADAASILGLPQGPSTSNAENEISLDDIPTKLLPLSEEELKKQIAEAEETNSLLLEVVEDISLTRNGDLPKDPPPPPSYL